MKTIMTRAAAAAALACIAGPAVTASPSASSYDFQYRRAGEAQILPLQVFDNGQETYFQFSERTAVLPAIIIETPDGMVVSKYHRSGPYIVIRGVATTYRLQFSSLSGTVQYAGASRPTTAGRDAAGDAGEQRPVAAPVHSPAQTAPAIVPAAAIVPVVARTMTSAAPAGPAYGLVPPLSAPVASPAPSRVDALKAETRVQFAPGKSALSPEALADLKAMLTGKGEVTKVMITGRDDADFKEGLARARALALRAAVLKLGVASERIVLREGFMLDNDDASKPTSDVVIQRSTPPVVAPSSSRVADVADPATVPEAIALIGRGMAALVRLKAIDELRAKEAFASIKRFAGFKEDEPLAATVVAAPAPAVSSAPVAASTPADGGRALATTAPAVPPEDTWAMLPSDGTAQRALRKWADRAGMTVEWHADVDYPINTPFVVRGTARTAISSIRDALALAKRPLTIEVDNTRVIVRNRT